MRRSLLAFAFSACLSGTWAHADPLQDCAGMLRFTGAPLHAGDHDLQRPLCRKGYVLSYNAYHRVADWVLEVLTPERLVKNVGRDGSVFKEDEELKIEERSRLSDYKGSNFDRGHLAPAGDMAWDQEAMDQSFLLSNMAPQEGIGFNRHIWKNLEDYVRTLVPGRETVVVISGPVYKKTTRAIQDGKEVKKAPEGKDASVTIPAGYYKIVYEPTRKRALGFMLPHEKLSGRKFEDFIVPIAEIEEATGLDFLAALSKRDQKRIETQKPLRWRPFDEG